MRFSKQLAQNPVLAKTNLYAKTRQGTDFSSLPGFSFWFSFGFLFKSESVCLNQLCSQFRLPAIPVCFSAALMTQGL